MTAAKGRPLLRPPRKLLLAAYLLVACWTLLVFAAGLVVGLKLL